MARAQVVAIPESPGAGTLPCGVSLASAPAACPLCPPNGAGRRGNAQDPRVSDLLWHLDGFNKFLLSASPLVRFTPALGREVCRALGFTRMVFVRADFSTRRISATAGWGLDTGAQAAVRAPFEAARWITAAMMSGTPAYTPSSRISAILPVDCVEQLRLGPLLCVPVHDSAGPVGAMLLDRHGEPFAADAATKDVARAVGKSIGRALEAAGAASMRSCAADVHLTQRQLQVLRLLGRGLVNKQIAHVTGLSVFTVRDHVSALLHELDVANRSAAVARGWQLGLLSEPPAVD